MYDRTPPLPSESNNYSLEWSKLQSGGLNNMILQYCKTKRKKKTTNDTTTTDANFYYF